MSKIYIVKDNQVSKLVYLFMGVGLPSLASSIQHNSERYLLVRLCPDWGLTVTGLPHRRVRNRSVYPITDELLASLEVIKDKTAFAYFLV